MANPPIQDWTFQQGDTIVMAFKLKKKNSNFNPNDPSNPIGLDNRFDPSVLSTAKFQMQWRVQPSDTKFVLDISNVATTGNRIEVIDANDNSVACYIDAATMAAIKAADYAYDVEITLADGTVSKAMKGTITVEAEVTR